jgi:hypothetical protein
MKNGHKPTQEASVDQATRLGQGAPGDAPRVATTRCGGYSG